MKIENILINWGLEAISDSTYYKEVDTPISFNYVKIQLFGDNLVSIRAGKKDEDYERSILKGYYLENPQDLLSVISKLFYLSNIFPTIVRVPERKKTF